MLNKQNFKKLTKPWAFFIKPKQNALENQRLFLKPIEVKRDAPFFFKLMNSEPYKQNIADRNITTIKATERLLRERFTNGEKFVFVIFDKDQQEAVGSCGLYSREGLKYMDIGYAILPEFFRKGYAYESSQLLINFARTKLNKTHLDGITSQTNQASRNLLTKLDFIEQGMIKIPEYQEELVHFQLKL